MKLIGRLRRYLLGRESEPAPVVDLLMAALENEMIRDDLVAVLKQDSFNRKSLLSSMIEEMSLRDAPSDVVEALSQLMNDEFADRARQYLEARGKNT